MIRYTKSAIVPSSLSRGVPANTSNCAAYDADAAAYRSGDETFDIKNGIYGTEVVKRQLKADQYDKCAFCEAIFDANVAGDVEHYRPKTAIMTDQGRIYPGYYWLGYQWANLSYACPDCNEYRKRDRFPLRNEAQRARDHHDDIGHEQPLLLDPYGAIDPRAHIQFKGEAPIGADDIGEITIDILCLKRTALARDRLAYLQTLTDLHDAIEVTKTDPRPEAAQLVARFRAKLAAAVLPRARFSAAAADHLAALAIGQNYLPAEDPLAS